MTETVAINTYVHMYIIRTQAYVYMVPADW